MLHVGILPSHRKWGDFLANLEFVVVDEAHTYRGVFGSHVANVLRRLRRVARAYGCRSALPARLGDDRQPGRAGGAAGRHRVRADRRRRRAAGRARVAMWNPPLIDADDRHAALGAGRGGRPVGRARHPRGADDLLPQIAARDRADPALRPGKPGAAGEAGAGGADRSLPRRLHAAAAARDRGPALTRGAAGGGGDRRARAGDRRRGARRGDLRHLPRDRGEPAADVGTGRAAAARAGGLRRRAGRARPVLLPPPGGVPRAAGRGGDPRPRQRADRDAPPDRGGLRAAAVGGRRRVLRRRLAGAGRTAAGSGGAAAGRRAAGAAAQRASSPRGSRCARPRPSRSR